MSCSPERISSYRRRFEDSSSSSYQVRVSSPSPVRRNGRHTSAGYSCRPGGGSVRKGSVRRRSSSAPRRSRMIGAGGNALVCVGPSGEPPIDLDVAAAESHEFLSTRTSERQEMVILNDRLAVYIDKVRSLEQQNKLLVSEIEARQNRFEKPSGLRLLYEEQLRELRKAADRMKVQRDISLAAKESTAAQLEAIKAKYEEAVELKNKAEAEIAAFRPDVDKATSSRIALEKKLEQTEAEMEFLKRVHQQEIDELMKEIYTAHVTATSVFTLPDLAAALKQIQTQYDDIAAKNLQEMDSWYKNKFDDLTKRTTGHVDKVRSVREEIACAKKDIQSKERELDTLKTRNEALEAQIRERQAKNMKEVEDLQARIEGLQLELKNTKEKIALHLREYQDLLNIKMALEIEITTYRKLIEGEDLRLSGMMHTMSLMSCSMSAIGSGISFSGGGVGGVGGVGVGVTGGSSRIGAVGAGVGMGGGAGSVVGGMGAAPTDDMEDFPGRTGGANMGGSRGLRAGGGGVGAGIGDVATGAGGVGGAVRGVGVNAGIGGMHTSTGGVGTAAGGRGLGGGVAGTEGVDDMDTMTSAGGVGTSVAGEGVSGSTGIGFSDGDVRVVGGKGDGGQDLAKTTRNGQSGGMTGGGWDGYDGISEAYVEQAVELTERRTVLIRTVRHDDHVLQTDHREHNYTITGAADDLDD